jgi:hypothetical protein
LVQKRASASSPAPASAADQERRAREIAAIAELTRRLRTEHDEYESAAQSWTSEAGERKREVRKAREGTLREIEAALLSAGMGDRAAKIEKLPFALKLAELENLVRALTAPPLESAPPAPAPNGGPPLAPSPLPMPVPASSTTASAPPGPAAVAPSASLPPAAGVALPWTESASPSPAPAPALPTPESDSEASPVAHTSIFARSHARPEASATETSPRRGVRRWTLGIRITAALVGLAVAVGGWHVTHRSSDASADAPPSAPPSVQTVSTEVLEPDLPSPRVEVPSPSGDALTPSAGPSGVAAPPPGRHTMTPLPRAPRIRPSKPGAPAPQPSGTRATRAQEANSNPY